MASKNLYLNPAGTQMPLDNPSMGIPMKGSTTAGVSDGGGAKANIPAKSTTPPGVVGGGVDANRKASDPYVSTPPTHADPALALAQAGTNKTTVTGNNQLPGGIANASWAVQGLNNALGGAGEVTQNKNPDAALANTSWAVQGLNNALAGSGNTAPPLSNLPKVQQNPGNVLGVSTVYDTLAAGRNTVSLPEAKPASKPADTPAEVPSEAPATAPLGGSQVAPTSNAPAEATGARYIAYDADGNPYYIGSDTGVGFVNGSQNGSTITGGDGSTWTKDANGNVVITDKNGRTYTIQGASVNAQPEVSAPEASAPRLNKDDYFNNGRSYLDAQRAAAEEQIRLKSQYAVDQGVNELTRAEEDAQKQFQTQRNQVSRDEQIGLDNQALYAEARGDKGGIGAAQYAAIQAQAAQNRLAVNQQQTQLATDTARQIADLRAQGAFEEADAILSLTQTYLGQLQALYENAEAYSLDVDKFNIQLEQWEAEYQMQVAQLTGRWNGAPTFEAQKSIASTALAMLQAGIDVGPEQKTALRQIYGLDDASMSNVLLKAQLSAKGTGGNTGSSGGNTGSSGADQTAPSGVDALYLAALQTTDPAQFVKENFKKYGLTKQPSDSSLKDWMVNENNIWYYDGSGISDLAKHERDKLVRGSTLAGALDEEKLDYIRQLYSSGKIDMNERNWLLSEAGLVGGM